MSLKENVAKEEVMQNTNGSGKTSRGNGTVFNKSAVGKYSERTICELGNHQLPPFRMLIMLLSLIYQRKS